MRIWNNRWKRSVWEYEGTATGKQSDRWECEGTKTGNHSMHSDKGM